MDKEFFKGMNLDEDISEEDFQYIVESWEKVQDFLSKEEFIDKFNENKEEYKDASFFSNDKDYVNLVVNKFTGREAEPIPTFDTETPSKIADVEPGHNGFSAVARVMAISNPKIFTTRKGDAGKLCNLQIADDTDNVRLVLWTENIKHIKHINEGDIVEITDVDCKEGFRGGKEFHLRPRSLLRTIDESSENYPDNIGDFPAYEENIISIEDIRPDEKVSILGRLIRVPTPHTYESNGKKGKVTSLEIQDRTGQISYTLWNSDVKLINSLDLKEGDTVKILNEQARERNGEISLSHWDGRIVKVEGDFDLPEYKENIIKIGDVQEIKDATLIGVVTKIQDTITFERQDKSKGYVKSIEIEDETGSIRVTLWGDDTKLKVSKGDILKVVGGNIEYDDYATSGYRVNTNWNTELKVNPDENEDLIEGLKENAKVLGPIPIIDVQDLEEDGEEIDTRVIELNDAEASALPSFEELEEQIYITKKIGDLDEDDTSFKVVARIMEIEDVREFTRQDDGSTGLVRNMTIGDETGFIDVNLWGEKTNLPFDINEAIKIQNPRISYNDVRNRLELSVGNSANILQPSYSELSTLPDIEELQNILYTEKDIDALEEIDSNVVINGSLSEVYTQRVLLPKCPFCNRTLEDPDEEECQNCGNYIEKPNYLLMVSGNISDGTGEIPITFFNEFAEELIGMSHDEIVEQYENEDYSSEFLEDKLNDLKDYNLKLLADVIYNDYDGQIKLRPKKILAKEY